MKGLWIALTTDDERQGSHRAWHDAIFFHFCRDSTFASYLHALPDVYLPLAIVVMAINAENPVIASRSCAGQHPLRSNWLRVFNNNRLRVFRIANTVRLGRGGRPRAVVVYGAVRKLRGTLRQHVG
jgi:hypothetical protein